MGASEADRTLFVGNIDPRVTEELMFELFLQAGPLIKVKIPKDKDGKTKNFAFVNFKHVESVPYAMNLLGGTKLFGRPLKIQFRSGSSHGSQNGSNVTPSHNPSGTGSPTHTPPLTPNTNRFDRSTDSVVSPGFTSPPMAQRSYSTQDDLQRQAVMNNILWQQTPFAGMSGFQISPQSNTSSPSPQQQNYYNQNKGLQTQQSWDPSGSQWKNRFSPQSSYQSDSRHYSRDQRYGEQSPDHRYVDPTNDHYYRRGRDDYSYDDRNQENRSNEYEPKKESHRDNKYRQSRH